MSGYRVRVRDVWVHSLASWAGHRVRIHGLGTGLGFMGWVQS